MDFRQKAGRWTRWVARIVGGLILGLFLTFAIGEGLHDFGTSSMERILGATVIIMLTGIGLTYWKIFWGCVVIGIGYVGFAVCEQSMLLDTPFAALPAIVILYSAAWLLEHNVSTVKHPN